MDTDAADDGTANPAAFLVDMLLQEREDSCVVFALASCWSACTSAGLHALSLQETQPDGDQFRVPLAGGPRGGASLRRQWNKTAQGGHGPQRPMSLTDISV